VSVAGGAKAGEPAADLAVALAITSAFRGRPLGASVYAFGELGLTGVVRPVSGEERRLAAGLARGMRHGVIPNSDVDAPAGATKVTGIEDAIESAFRS
jgi:DNA repair protein RadA/Sms